MLRNLTDQPLSRTAGAGSTDRREDVMMVRTRAVMLALCTLALVACDTRPSTGVGGGVTATVRFVNATGTSLDVALNGSVGSANGNLGYGTSSSCISVDVSSSDMSIRATGTTTALPGFTPSFAAGERYIVVAYPDANGTPQFTTLQSTGFTPASGQGGLRVFDGAAGSSVFDVYVTTPGFTLGSPNATNLSFGSSTPFFNAEAGTQQVRLTNSGSQTVVFNAGSLTITAGHNSILVIAPAAPGSTVLRSFLVPAC